MDFLILHKRQALAQEEKKNQAFSMSEQVNLSADQLLRQYCTPNLFQSINASTVMSVRKKVDGRLTDSLAAEYLLGFDVLQGDSAQHAGMRLLEGLRRNRRRATAALEVSQCVTAENGPQSDPARLLAATRRLRREGAEVTFQAERFALNKQLKIHAAAKDWQM